MLQEYWHDTKRSFEMGAASNALWADMLEGWTPEQVRWALRKHMAEEPSRRPNPGHILKILKKSWGEKQAAEMRRARNAARTTHESMTTERHAEVCSETEMAEILNAFIRRVPGSDGHQVEMSESK